MKRIYGALLLAACMLPFLPGLYGPFMLDDTSNLGLARAETGSFNEIWFAVTQNGSGLLHRPISNLSFLLNYHLLGPGSFGYKAVNLFLHFLTACVLWRVAKRIVRLLYPDCSVNRANGTGLLIAALWALHPIQISTVLYVVQRMAELSALFVALALWLFLFFIEKSPSIKGIRTPLMQGIAVWALVILGLLSKENAALFPAFVMAVYLSADDRSKKLFVQNRSTRLLFAICGWLPTIFCVFGAYAAFSWITQSYAARDFTLSGRLLTEPFIVFRYLGTILFPDIKHMGLYLDDMPLRQADDPWTWLVLTAILLLPPLAIVLRRRAPAITFAVLWFVSAHLLESTFIPLELAFEHRNYFALFGPMFAAGYYLTKVLFDAPLRVVRLALVLPVAALAAATVVRAHQWSTPKNFLQHEAENHPFSPRAQNEIINIDVETGEIEKVIAGVKKVQSLKPDSFWPISLDLNIACGVPGHPIPWGKMEAQVTKRPEDFSVLGVLLFDTDALTHNNCLHVDTARFETFLGSVASIYSSNNMPDRVEKTFVLRAHIASFKHEQDRAISLLRAGADANPKGLQALHELAYYSLNLGLLARAEETIVELQSRVSLDAPSQQYDVDELRRYLATAKREKSDGELLPARD